MQRSFAESETVSRILYEEKAQELLAKDEMLQVIPAILDNCRLLFHLLTYFDMANNIDSDQTATKGS